MDPHITVVVIDDHPAILAGVIAWCAAADPPIHVTAAGGQVSLAWSGPGRTAPIVVFDLQLRGQPPAFAEVRKLAEANRSVIVYSQRTDDASVRTCLSLGAFTYLTKAEGPDHLIPAIRAASQHLPYVSPSLGGAMLSDGAPDRPKLSPRERDALAAWFECASKRLAARRLNVTVSTVETLIERARLKYAEVGRPAPTKAALLERAYQDRLIDPPSG